MLSRPSFSEFYLFYEKVQNFFEGRQSPWASRLLFEGMRNVSFIKDVSLILDKTRQPLKYQDIDDLIQLTRNRTNIYLKKAMAENDLGKKFDLASTMMGYFGLTECLHEHGAFTDKVFEELRKEFGENYLSELQKVDQEYLSVDTQKLYHNFPKKEWPQNDAICKYLVLKKWQDDQHVYYLQHIENFIWPLEDAYIQSKEQQEYFPPNLKHINNINALKIRSLEEMRKNAVIPIDLLSMNYLAGLDQELIKFVGGKAYGLAILRAKGATIPETFVCPTYVAELSSQQLDKLPNYRYAVRSSADIEDGCQYSFAGMFDSCLDVKHEDLQQAFQTVKSSVNNSRVETYMAIHSLNNPHMSVILQKFKEPELSGVWIGSSPNSGVLEWVEGNGEKLVSGRITPNHEEYDGQSNSDNDIRINGETVGNQLIKLQQLISQTGTADFEWCILDKKLVMLQYRPVTADISQKKHNSQAIDNENTFKGLSVSPGLVEGSAKFVRKMNEVGKWNDGDILMAWFTDPEWMPVMLKSSGIVTAVGGFLCHTAIIARELGIPCVVGIGGDSMKKIWDKTYLSINGTTGVVSTKSQKNARY